MPTGSEGASGRIKEAVGTFINDQELKMEGELQRKRDDAELETRGWSQPKSHVSAVEEAEERAKRMAEEDSA